MMERMDRFFRFFRDRRTAFSGLMPSADTFSYGLRSKCADLAELLQCLLLLLYDCGKFLLVKRRRMG